MRYWQVRNWTKYQHYKDRSPPWVKLYTSLLTDYEFGRLPDAHKAHAMSLYLLAAKLCNRIPDDAEWVGRQISATEPVDLQALAAYGLLERASETLADSKQVARPETETETETEGEVVDSDRVFAQQLTIAANGALRDNPNVKAIEPLRVDWALPHVKAWTAEGIPEATILATVVGICQRFTPKGPGNRAIRSFGYFDRAVREAHQPDPMAAVIRQMEAEHGAA